MPGAVTLVALEVGTPGGMERQVGELCMGLLERGHRVTVVAARCGLPAHPGLRVIRVRVPRRPAALAYPAFIVAGSLALHRHRAGVVHATQAVVCNRVDVLTVHFCHHGFRAAFGTPQMARDSLPYRVNAAAMAWMGRAAERICYRPGRARRLVVVSGGLALELERHFPGRRDLATVIANGVDRAGFAPDPAVGAEVRDHLGLAADDLVALFVGGDWDRKGLSFAIEGVAAAGQWHLVVVGYGDEARYRALSSRCAAGTRVHFTGTSPDPARFYACADALLLPSAYEGFPLVGLEAAASGLPLLAGRVNGIEELVEEGRNGWFVERDAEAIAERLRMLGADRALRIGMGLAARDSSEPYTWDKVVDAYEGLYEALASDPRASSG